MILWSVEVVWVNYYRAVVYIAVTLVRLELGDEQRYIECQEV